MISIKQAVKNKARDFYKEFVFKLSAGNNPLFLTYYKKYYKPKKGSVAAFADFFSRRNQPLTVIQVGANDGFTHDPIHKFIKRDKWRGVLLEPQPDVYHQYLERLHKNSPGIHTLNAALNYQDGTSTIYKVSFSTARWATGLTSFDRSVVEKAVNSAYVKDCARQEGVSIPVKIDDRIQATQIKTISPRTLLEKYQVKTIDWLQIDAEGFDFEIIKMFDIATTQPRVIVFEHFQFSDEERKKCFDYLREHAYQLKPYGRDALAILNPSAEYLRFLQ